MSRQEILDQVQEAFGLVPGYLSGAPDHALAKFWSELGWLSTDTALSARDKVLVAFGAASAIHCEY